MVENLKSPSPLFLCRWKTVSTLTHKRLSEIKMRHSVVFTLALLLALTFCEPLAFSTQPMDKRIQGFHEVKKLPETMVAGSSYEWTVSFVNPKSENASMNVTLEITEEKTDIGSGEFSVEGALESCDNPSREYDCLTLIFAEETEGGIGIFQNQTVTEERFNHITLRISSVPNLMPGTYTFTLIVTLQFEE